MLEENDQGTITVYGYNSQNQMVQNSAGGFTTNYQYNTDGIRHAQSDSIVTTHYLVDANRSYAQVLAESVNGSLDVAYHYGDDLISQSRGGGVSYFHVDGLGSTRVLTDSVGNSTDSYAYAAFGEVLAQSGLTDNSYLYTGEQYDSKLDQYYLRARYYDQGVGRFTQMDIWMGNNADPVTLNKYLYGNSDPVDFTDPTGLFGFGFGGIGAATSIRGNLATIGVSGASRLAINRVIGATIKLGRTVTSGLVRGYLKKCVKKKDKCRLGFNMLIIGFDAPSMIEHIDSAQSYLPRTYRLTWDFKNRGKSHKKWYVKRGAHFGGCGIYPKPSPSANCDEYPMQSTLQGGERNYSLGRVSLKWVVGSENQYVGAHFGGMTRAMKKSKNYNFWVITTTSFPTSGLPLAKGKNQ